MAFLRRPIPFSLSVLSPAESVSGRLTPASSRARAGRAARNRPERAKAARERHEKRFIKNLLRGVDSTGTRGHVEGRSGDSSKRMGPWGEKVKEAGRRSHRRCRDGNAEAVSL